MRLGHWRALALGLIKQGSIQRLQSNWVVAIALYRRAGEVARRAKNIAYEADALAWSALAEKSRRNLGQAVADATQARWLAEAAGDRDVLAERWTFSARSRSPRGISGASDTLNREVEVAAQAKDPMTAYYAYSNRADVYLKTAEKCDFQRVFKPCYQALDRAHADLQKALEIARNQGFLGLARETEESIDEVNSRRALVKSQESAHRTEQQSSVFRPTKPADVFVSEKFVMSSGQIPPIVNQKYDEWKRIAGKAGGFADVVEARSHYVEGLMNQMEEVSTTQRSRQYLKAVDTLEHDRRGLNDERSRGTFLSSMTASSFTTLQCNSCSSGADTPKRLSCSSAPVRASWLISSRAASFCSHGRTKRSYSPKLSPCVLESALCRPSCLQTGGC